MESMSLPIISEVKNLEAKEFMGPGGKPIIIIPLDEFSHK